MRPIRAGKIHVPLAAIGGKKGNNRKKKTQPGWELQLALCNSSDPFCPFHLLFPMVFNGIWTNQLGETR